MRLLSMTAYVLVSISGIVVSMWLASSLLAPSYSQNAAAPAVNQATPPPADPAAASVPPAMDLPPPSDAALPPPMAVDTQISPNEENFIYDPTGKRDPFILEQPELKAKEETAAAPGDASVDGSEAAAENAVPEAPKRQLEPLEEFDVAEIRVVAIIWDTKSPKALVQDPTGKLHSVKLKSRIGRVNGVVVAIREGEIVVAEKAPDGPRKFVIMNLKK